MALGVPMQEVRVASTMVSLDGSAVLDSVAMEIFYDHDHTIKISSVQTFLSDRSIRKYFYKLKRFIQVVCI